MADFDSEIDLSGLGGSSTDKAELQRMLAVEQQKAQFTAQVHNFMDVCWDKCMDKPGNKLDSRTENCLVNCVDRFIDTTLSITNRFAQIVQKGTH
ncbi:PREDICTED: mitochondrial import inner membrane translocase subunit Tim8 B [Nanorana parkeri]|uniref:mitochondrial import inner membrane translocase subunit Tim8 B n=1 Tax=Nanorana parkeri TaxID=125878 RepID=UPI000854639C|nr:PREDICTED: mitochondrial import inner membrane translocase subunit Tim8 B [Nanorana parkeri]